jgi:hypothetical protein
MSKLFDTALPPAWYLGFWLLLLAAFVIAVRLFIVNPLLRESERVRAEINALRR